MSASVVDIARTAAEPVLKVCPTFPSPIPWTSPDSFAVNMHGLPSSPAHAHLSTSASNASSEGEMQGWTRAVNVWLPPLSTLALSTGMPRRSNRVGLRVGICRDLIHAGPCLALQALDQHPPPLLPVHAHGLDSKPRDRHEVVEPALLRRPQPHIWSCHRLVRDTTPQSPQFHQSFWSQFHPLPRS